MRGKYIVYAALWLFYGCALEKNDVDPQVSQSSVESKKNSVFIKQYKVLQKPDSFFNIEEVWLEQCWKYKTKNLFTVEKELIEGEQFVIKLKKEGLKNGLTWGNFHHFWRVTSDSNQYVGFNSETFSISGELVDTFHLNVLLERNGEFKKVGSIILYK